MLQCLAGDTAKWTLEGVCRIYSKEERKAQVRALGTPQAWGAFLRGRCKSQDKDFQKVGDARCAPLAHILLLLWLEENGWEPKPKGRFLEQGRMLGKDAAGNDIKPQVRRIGGAGSAERGITVQCMAVLLPA
jgi:hypothetical protein